MFSFDEDVYICNTYIPPANSNVINVNDFDFFFDTTESGIERYKISGKCFITGDFNSRCANVTDFIEYDRYINNNNELSNSVYIPPRVSKDHVLDRFGNRLIELCKATSFIIGNGRLHSDAYTGDYTFHSYKGSSVVDYLLLHTI